MAFRCLPTDLQQMALPHFPHQPKFCKTMFQEHNNDRQGRIEVICGSMFSGKTEELIRRLKRARIARQRVEIYKPAIDTRYSEADVVSHDANSISSTPVSSAWSILTLASEAEVVGIDEAQFSMMHCPMFANYWPTAVNALSLPDSTWTSRVCPLAQCLRSWLLPRM